MTEPSRPAAADKRPSAEIASAWPIDGPTNLVAYADVTGLSRTTLAVDLEVIAEMAGAEANAACVVDAFARSDELALGRSDDGTIVLIRAKEPAANVDIIRACAETFAAGAAIETRGSLVAVGSSELVRRAAKATRANPFPLKLQEGQLLSLRAKFGGGSVQGAILDSEGRFSAACEIEPPDEASAREVEASLELPDPSDPRLVGIERRMLDTMRRVFHVTRDGRRVRALLSLSGSATEQARDMRMVGAFGVYATRTYLSRAKQLEARNVLAELARVYSEHWVRSPKRALASYPVIPKTIPSGKKAQTTRDEWRAYEPLGFWMSDPQYFQYEIKASSDGKKVSIIARGDLDGDGKPSRFELKGSLDAKRNLVFAPSIEETDPDE